MKHKTDYLIKGKCRATTLPELLIVIILSGILFLLAFEGMNIVNKYNLMFKDRLLAKNELFYSHSVLELLMEDTDSIRKSDEENILLFYKTGEVKRMLSLDSCGFCISYGELRDTIFSRDINWELHFKDEKEYDVDSIIIKACIDDDTLTLEYGLPFTYNFLNTDKTYATIQ